MKRLELDNPVERKKVNTWWKKVAEKAYGRFPTYDFLLSTSRINKILFIFKMHPFRKLDYDFNQSSNVIQYADAADVYLLLPPVDLLITDYTSIFFDFLYLNQPIIFFPYDYDKYIKEDRSLKYDYNWVTPGPKCMNQKDLQRCIQKVLLNHQDEYADKRRSVFNMSFSHKNGSAAKHIIQCLQDEITHTKDDRLQSINYR